ncbi:global transcription regulator sge1-like isoform X2 [Quercus lobata]|uniref:global transcription regulator sge1-like isoform X2 n=1 Tax=Quercus lobata TaxID=97700 RepID=UPI001244CF54|nr:global transcription regulator sge1-like isoform X2 [Quercus lobata]
MIFLLAIYLSLGMRILKLLAIYLRIFLKAQWNRNPWNRIFSDIFSMMEKERERDIMKIPEVLNGKVIHLEHQPALHRPIMHPKEDQPALRRPIMHPEEDWPALCRPTMHPEEDQPALHRPIMQPEEDQPALHRPTMHPEEDHRHPMHPEEDEPAIQC